MQTRFAFGPSSAPLAHGDAARRPPSRTPSRGGTRGRAAGGVGEPDALLVLDIETVPDAALLPPEWPADRFPKNAWHRIVAISSVTADILRCGDGREGYAVTACRSGGRKDWGEARLLDAFWRFFEAGRYRVVTWNGRAFDMPTILARSMIHGIDAPAWFRRGTKWDGYRHRFALDWHTDLMDATSEHGAAPRMTLGEAAAALGLPGKLGEHGSEVAAMMAAGEADRVRAYCETDCINLFALYLRWAHLTGRADAASHDRAILDLADYLGRERGARPHLGRFRDAWTAMADGRAMIGPLASARGGPPVTEGDAIDR
ncbi:ribonuclease H-like domain-containing protein [Methylobacterium pseudosasicola]|uniref:Predicted 3'-5' exonuclease related to the exonuclease domain of PolB n=1 Tax=Methylobacterium pseudosasicola TaxID=582667 RepID=A0A1I4H3H4_9HYPH|nr:ribonuclease H-like domain-containing protein [Methylobacterium pseudosasicola]SFL36745.1 Predicted 3'-5' exonuclease related to the exonuclease domain of PolB [Methylobacterium pseudosasicola]